MSKIRKCWCITDYEDKFVLLEIGQMWPNGNVVSDTHIIPMLDFEYAKKAWSTYNEWQFGECPYPVKG